MSSKQQSPFEAATSTTKSEGPATAPTSPPTPAVMIRKLPRNTTKDTLNSMLLFAKDLISVDFAESQDAGYRSALAKFQTDAGAREARTMLNGKPNFSRDANMIVEVVSSAMGEGLWRAPASAKSPEVKGIAPTSQATTSRWNETFQALDRDRVTSPIGHPNGDAANGHQSYFGHNSPITSTLGRQSNTGKSMISNDVDDETGKLLDDPMGFMTHDLAPSGLGTGMGNPTGRRSTLPHVQVPVNGFGNLSINGNSSTMTSPRVNGMVSPRIGPLQSPGGFPPNNLSNLGANASYQFNSNMMRHNFPPINPSDQNPPCNTLYVGNLPMDAAEDELKSVFSKQRGYKRLCLRTKANGPMCFVEFEDITCASKALTECYGVPLHNSTKGGIRLSFSKNPLGVRTGQPGSMGGQSGMSPQGPMPGMGNMMNYSAVTGPPPGLAAPPGILGGVNGAGGGMGMNGNGNGMGVNGTHGHAHHAHGHGMSGSNLTNGLGMPGGGGKGGNPGTGLGLTSVNGNGGNGPMPIGSPNGTPATMNSANGFPNPLMSPVGSISSQTIRTPTSAIGQGWNWPSRESTRRENGSGMMGR